MTSIIIAVFASSGFWAFITGVMNARREKNHLSTEKLDAMEQGVKGLLHNDLVDACEGYITRGKISEAEYRDLKEYIFEPYQKLGGNGTGEEYMKRTRELLFKEEKS